VKFYAYLRYRVLPQPLNDDDSPSYYSEKWGRFPPDKRYNMDQVPLPFVVSQESTFTRTEDDEHVAIKFCSGSGDMRKRQFSMHVFCNAGRDEKRDGYTVLIGRATSLKGDNFK